MYSIGYGVSAIDNPSPLKIKVLCLSGDGNSTMRPPTPICLPNSILTRQNVPHITVDQFKAKITEKKTDYTYPLIRRTHTTNSSQVMCISPVSADMVYYGFENDLDAEIILERLFTLDVDNSPMLSNAQTFLLACITAQGQNGEKPSIPL